MEATHVVVRDFSGNGVRYHARQAVDATAWPNVSALIRSNYLRPRTVMDVAREAAETPVSPLQEHLAVREAWTAEVMDSPIPAKRKRGRPAKVKE